MAVLLTQMFDANFYENRVICSAQIQELTHQMMRNKSTNPRITRLQFDGHVRNFRFLGVIDLPTTSRYIVIIFIL